ncbi:VOC family protein [Algibacillus agarilyticus]|uniref:VOC family protein n=1 Tax=Algibacillus agarilyticus TaxID=2234133 RepID=UPI000DCFD499|nr:VOC family protein [Algibacillus agarilyticus]
MFVNARHTGIVVNNIENSVDFYQRLGFVIENQDIEIGTFIDQVTGYKNAKLEWVKLRLGDGFLLELLKYHSHPADIVEGNAPANKQGCSHIAFSVLDSQLACDLILALGGSLVNQPALAPNGKVKVAYCYDPEGVLLEIVEEIK